MDHSELQLGFATADAEAVQLAYDGADLVLTCVDWRGKPVRHSFRDVLAYQWGQDVGAEDLRNDQAYEIHGSEWLVREASLAGVAPQGYAHYKLCFNACGVLDVLARRHA